MSQRTSLGTRSRQPGRWQRVGWMLSTVLAVVTQGAVGIAEAQQPRAVVLSFEGRYPTRLREEVVSALSDHVQLVSKDEFRGAAVELDSASDYARAASATQVSAIISGSSRRRGRTIELTITLRGGDGEVIRDLSVTNRNPRRLARQVRQRLWDQLGNDILGAPAPTPLEAEEPEPLDVAPEEVEEVEIEPSGPRPSPLQVFAGVRIFNRDFSYSDDVTAMPPGASGGLRAYELPAASAVELDFVLYPLAFFMDGIAADIGIEGGFYYGLFLNSQECRQRNPTTQACERTVDFPTSASGLQLGARMRFHVDDHEIYGRVGYQSVSFRIEALDVDNPAPQVPDAGYDFLRVGAGARFVFAPIIIEPRAALLLVLGTGQISESAWFPDSGAFAFEAGLRLGVQVLDWLEIMGSFDFSQVAVSLNDGPGSATDRYISGSLGAQLRIPDED